VEFSNAGAYHHFNLQLAGTLQLEVQRPGRWQTQWIVPGHASLNVATEPFRCVVSPSPGTLALHVVLPPAWLERVRDTASPGSGGRMDGLAPLLGSWQSPIRDASLRLVAALRGAETASRWQLDERQWALAVALLQSQRADGRVLLQSGRLSFVKLKRIMEYLSVHLADDVGLETLAAGVGLSPFHFARAFKASVGLAPHQYVSEMRLKRAQLFLATTSRSLTEIAMSLGYDTPSHFSNAFRRRLGLTPSRFRAAAT